MNTPRVVRRPEIPEWLEKLASIPNGSFPMEEMQLIWDRGDEIEELLLQYLQWLADESEMGWLELEDDGWLHFIAFFLLSDRGCPELFQPLVDIAMDEDYADFVLGDAITEDLPAWLAAVGSPEALRALVDNEDANPWLVMAALGALGTMAWVGRIPQEEHHDYLKELAAKRERTDHPIWMEWLSQVGYFAWTDLLETVAELEKAGMFFGKEGVASTEQFINKPGREKWAADELCRYTPGGNEGLKQFSKYPCFQPGFVEEVDRQVGLSGESASATKFDPEFIPLGPIPREEPKIGRNDPCPCGSGKKWKKCCGK